MDIDYKRLCQDYFGTTDIEQLKKIADQIHQENPRNAGRKAKFSAEDVERMQEMLCNGSSIEEIAAVYRSPRQVISRYLNPKPAPGCTMRMTLMYQTRPCTIIDVDFLHQTMTIQNRTNDLLHRAFGVNENPSWDDFEYFLQDRCFPASRGNAKELFEELGLTNYDPLAIIEKTKGRMAEDQFWIKFSYYDRNGTVQNVQN